MNARSRTPVAVGLLLLMICCPLGGCGKSEEKGSGTPEQKPPATPPVAKSAASQPSAYQSTERTMAAFFSAARPATAPAAPSLGSLVGTWEARIVSIDADGDANALRDPSAIPPFAFTIKPSGDGYLFTRADGTGKPRALVATPAGIVARGEGAADVTFSLQDQTLVGTMHITRPAPGRIEFHATRK